MREKKKTDALEVKASGVETDAATTGDEKAKPKRRKSPPKKAAADTEKPAQKPKVVKARAESTPEPAKKSSPEPKPEPAKKPAIKSAKKSAKKPVKELAKKPAKEPANGPENGSAIGSESGRVAERDAPTEKPRRDAESGGRGSVDREGVSDREPGEGRERGEGGGDEGGGKKKRRRRRKGRGGAAGGGGSGGAGGENPFDPETESARPRTRRMVTKPKAGWSRESFELAQDFGHLGLKPELVSTIAELGFEHPTKIQSELVPLALTGRDILGQAKTGTGKTAAFALPLLHMVTRGERFSALILAPTRELAVQIKQDFDDLGRRSGLTAVAIYGGQSIKVQADRLARGPEIIVGTPGRIQDMVERGFLNLSGVRFAVLDEVDRMFDIGFRDDIRRILKMCPDQRQTIFVSATFTDEIESLARRYMNDPFKLVVSSGSLTVELVKQGYVTVEPWDKKRMLAHLLTHEEPALTLVFCRMKRTVDDVVRYLTRKDIEAHAIHGDMSQGKRNSVMDQFRSGQLAVLVASDLASRGIDVDGITHVVNYDLPDDPDLYVHRIGRTARAGHDGHAWSLVTPRQGTLLTDIELLVNTEIPRMDYPDFEARQRPEDWKDEPTGGRPIYEVKGVMKEQRNRFETEAPPKAEAMTDAQKASKFPGGVVPSKLPPKLLRGKAKTRGR